MIEIQGFASHQSDSPTTHASLEEALDRFVTLRRKGFSAICVTHDGTTYRWSKNRLGRHTSSGWRETSPFDAQAESDAILGI